MQQTTTVTYMYIMPLQLHSRAKYPLAHGVLTADFPLGVSNHFVGEPVTITVEKGALLVCVCDDE